MPGTVASVLEMEKSVEADAEATSKGLAPKPEDAKPPKPIAAVMSATPAVDDGALGMKRRISAGPMVPTHWKSASVVKDVRGSESNCEHDSRGM